MGRVAKGLEDFNAIIRRRKFEAQILAKRSRAKHDQEYFHGAWWVWRRVFEHLEVLNSCYLEDWEARKNLIFETCSGFERFATLAQDRLGEMEDREDGFLAGAEDTWRKAAADFEEFARAVAVIDGLIYVYISEVESFCEHPWTHLRIHASNENDADNLEKVEKVCDV
jgi:hypothetical protein